MSDADTLQKVRVLYAEDSPFDADLTRAYFETDAPDFELTIVHTGEECFARLTNGAYDVLLLDNHLPDMDAVRVLQHIAASRAEIPIVVTTSVGDETLAVRLLQLGADDYVPKDGSYLGRLPGALRNAIAEHQTRQDPHGGRRPERRVLYVEHHASDIDLTVTHLAEFAPHFTVEVVSSAAEVLTRLSQGHVDLVLTDLQLPQMNALDLLKEARARGLLVPFIVVTGGGDETAAVKALKLGAFDYIVKRDDYLTRLPHAIEHAIARFELAQINRRLQEELVERQRLQVATAEALSLLDSLQKHAPIGIAFMDRDYRFQRVNNELANIIGQPVARLLGRTVSDAAPELSRRIEPLYRRALAGEAVLNVDTVGASSTTSDDAQHVAVSLYPVRTANHEVLGVGLAASDITQRKQAEAALRDHANAMAELARQKDEFLAMLSHELRNPLAPIRTALELLRRAGAPDDLSARAQQVIDRQVTYMARMLDDLLDVARIRSGRIDLKVEMLDLRSIVGQAMDSVRDLIDARRHSLEALLPPDPVWLRGDPTRLVQVTVNLLNNAAKYTDEGGRIVVSVAEEGGHVVLRVQDTGMGIPARLMPKVFDLFTQDDRTLDRAQGGLGLGLTIVRRLIELHGGSVDARSQGRGFGSEFTVRLPLQPAPAAAAAPPASEPASRAHAKRCLVVEDNVDAARMLELALAIEGHDVRLAFDGRDAVELAAQYRPEVVVLDIGLPRMNGYDVARAIRKLPGLAGVHIIGVTGYGQAAETEKSREAGFDTHLVKPVELDILLRTIAFGRTVPAG
jgi:PAS domain S-box-containing protein